MSTRGTYTIQEKQWNEKVKEHHIYVHYDNYPTGAAFYFANMIKCPNKRGGAVLQFIRTNDNAEFTTHPDDHGDTEYHYELDVDWFLSAYAIDRDWSDNGKDDKKRIIFRGHVCDFINQNNEMVEPKDTFLTYRGWPMTKAELQKQYDEKLAKGLLWTAKGHIGNASSTIKECYQMLKVLIGPNASIPPEIAFCAEVFTKAYNHESVEAYIDRCIKS